MFFKQLKAQTNNFNNHTECKNCKFLEKMNGGKFFRKKP